MLKSMLTATALCALALNISIDARAADATNDYGAVVMDPVAKKECGDCHMAFAPIKLPGRSWRVIMGDLANHFGENATLDAATAKHIEDYLVSKSMDEGGTMFGKISYKKMMKKQAKDYTPLRITDTSDWRGDHNSGKFKRMLADKNLKSGANCVVCHKGAPEGRYEEFDNLPD
ncbi:MAG TPA: hypothetical protein VIN57_01455 [Magnetovibrio sp.]